MLILTALAHPGGASFPDANPSNISPSDFADSAGCSIDPLHHDLWFVVILCAWHRKRGKMVTTGYPIDYKIEQVSLPLIPIPLIPLI